MLKMLNPHARASVAVLAAGALVLAGCGDDGNATETTPDDETAVEADAASESANACGSLVIEEQFVRLPATDNSALYFTVTNESDVDTALVGASADIADTFELHEVTMDGEEMVMQEVADGTISVPAGTAVNLEPGGLHVMALGVTGEVAEGDLVDWTLEFEGDCTKNITAEVRAVDVAMNDDPDSMGGDSEMGDDMDEESDMDSSDEAS